MLVFGFFGHILHMRIIGLGNSVLDIELSECLRLLSAPIYREMENTRYAPTLSNARIPM